MTDQIPEPDQIPEADQIPESQRSHKPRRRLIIGVGVLAAAGVVFAAVGGGGGGNEVVGTTTLRDMGSAMDETDCSGSGGYSDIDSSAQVVIEDGDGKKLAVTNLGTGNQPHTDTGDEDSDSLSNLFSKYECEFTWSVNVPDADFYVVKLGSRGELTFTKAELADQDWEVSTSLGS